MYLIHITRKTVMTAELRNKESTVEEQRKESFISLEELKKTSKKYHVSLCNCGIT